MTEPKPVLIRASYVGPQPLLSIIESNVDLDNVVVERTEFAIKAIAPLDLLIEATSTFILQEYVLKPLLSPVAEKFNWKKAVIRHLRPIDSFNLTIRIESENFVIEAPLEAHHEITAEIWALIQKALDILQKQSCSTAFSKIRFTAGQKGELLIICYEQSRPTHTINLEEGKVIEIPSGQIIEDESELTWEAWAEKERKKAEAYQQFIEETRRKQENGKG